MNIYVKYGKLILFPVSINVPELRRITHAEINNVKSYNECKMLQKGYTTTFNNFPMNELFFDEKKFR